MPKQAPITVKKPAEEAEQPEVEREESAEERALRLGVQPPKKTLSYNVAMLGNNTPVTQQDQYLQAMFIELRALRILTERLLTVLEKQQS